MDKWDYAHMKTAENYAQLSHAKRAKVGAVIVKDNRIISIGYNGMPSGWENDCEDVISKGFLGHKSDTKELKTKSEVLHAEANAITKVAQSSESTLDSTIYCTMLPCMDCAKLIYQSGIKRVYYREDYPKGTKGLNFLYQCGIMVNKI